MTRTVGKHWPSSAPRGDTVAMCDICGVHWRRSVLRLMPNGQLWCPTEGDGRDEQTLAQLNAQKAQRPARQGQQRPGSYDRRDVFAPTEHFTTWEQVEGDE